MTFSLTHQEDDYGQESYHTQSVVLNVADDADISELCRFFEHFLNAKVGYFRGLIRSVPEKEWVNSWVSEDDATA